MLYSTYMLNVFKTFVDGIDVDIQLYNHWTIISFSVFFSIYHERSV